MLLDDLTRTFIEAATYRSFPPAQLEQFGFKILMLDLARGLIYTTSKSPEGESLRTLL